MKTTLLNDKLSKDAKKKALKEARRVAAKDGTDPEYQRDLERLEEILDITGTVDSATRQALAKGVWLSTMKKSELEEIAEMFAVPFKKHENKGSLLGRLCQDPRVQVPDGKNSSSASSTSSAASSSVVVTSASERGTHDEEIFVAAKLEQVTPLERKVLLTSIQSELSGKCGSNQAVTSIEGELSNEKEPANTAIATQSEHVEQTNIFCGPTVDHDQNSTQIVVPTGEDKSMSYTGTIPSLRVGDWICYQFQVIYFKSQSEVLV